MPGPIIGYTCAVVSVMHSRNAGPGWLTNASSAALVPVPTGTRWVGDNEFNVVFSGDSDFTRFKGSYENWLPSFDFDVSPTDNIKLRASYSHTITRADYANMQGGRTLDTLFRGDESCEVVAFTAAQIPDIEGRTYPPVLAGPLYPRGIPIRAEEELESIVRQHGVDEVWFSYSDVAHVDVMHKGSAVIGWGAHFGTCSATRTMICSPLRRP